MTSGGIPHDRGLQAERTDLAWSRTAIAVLVSGVLVSAREVLAHSLNIGVTVWVGLATAVVVALAVAGLGRRRRRRLATTRPSASGVAPGMLTAVTVLVCLLTATLVTVSVLSAP